MSIGRDTSMRLYMQVANAIRSEIAAGHPPVGGLLPGEKKLAARYGVGRNTVRDAMAMLRAEGLIDGRQGYRSRVLWGVPAEHR
jgi:GntR family transcriptional regulator, transcriptional repressor for pyruvate dehydrogenase complex